ncbi:MAG: PfkB family carbohydrate kinase [Halobaculum sp.]
MTDIVVFGSANLYRTSRVSVETVERLARENDWFPDPGETVTVESPPESFDADATRLGGKGANQAVAAARATASVSLFGAVGPDADEFGVRPPKASTPAGWRPARHGPARPTSG